MEAIAHSGTIVAVLSNEGIAVVGVRQKYDPFLESSKEKILEVNSNICCALTGFTIKFYFCFHRITFPVRHHIGFFPSD